MKTLFAFVTTLAITLLLSSAPLAQANQVMVQELQVNPNQIATISVPGFYTGSVYAGVNKLLVAGTPMDGFCIDPYHFSSTSPLLYNVVPLSLAPKPPGTMTALQATQISKLWTMFYSTSMTSSNAAGMQIAIWEIVAGSQIIQGNDFGASNMLTSMRAYTGAGADLVALTGPGQDYVVRRTNILSTPDSGSTLALFGLVLAALLTAHMVSGKNWRSAIGC